MNIYFSSVVVMILWSLLPGEKSYAQQAECPFEETYPVIAELYLSADTYFLLSLRRNGQADFDTLRDVRVWVHNVVRDEIVYTALLYTFGFLTFEDDVPCLIEDNLITGSDEEGYYITTSERNTPFTMKGIKNPIQIQVTLESRRPYLVLKSNVVELKIK